jgi:hypothetical protein
MDAAIWVIPYIETILRYVYYVRNGDEWEDVVDILQRSEPLIRETAMTTIAEMLIEKRKAPGGSRSAQRASGGTVRDRHVEKLARVQSYDVLVSLRRRRKHCRTLEELESLVERAMQ